MDNRTRPQKSTHETLQSGQRRGKELGSGGGGGTEGGGANREADIPEVNWVALNMNALLNRRSLKGLLVVVTLL